MGVGVGGDGAEEGAVGEEVVELVLDDGEEPGFEGAGVGEGLVDGGVHLLLGTVVEGEDDGVLGVEVVVGGSGGDSGVKGDFSHGGGVKPALAEDGERGVEDAGTGFFGLRRGLGGGLHGLVRRFIRGGLGVGLRAHAVAWAETAAGGGAMLVVAP